ncbi:ligand-binding sensor domain-containing protein [Sphingobacterium paludis]|uniref:Ligand-binding sensor domain-containing protein n=2 Tax=Sphingobacterium paludis TaxID=1476465 RepID=A0A4V3E2J8_9SPHI|nr:ligand-binding sensor domain-containing protein [Sphingobacterium paludis]
MVAMVRFIIFSIAFLNAVYSFAQSIPSVGSPFVQNYTKSQYKAGNQNWSIAQGKDGIMYAANNNGLIAFNGAYWDLYPLSNKNFTRSVAVAANGDVFVGGKEEFGYFEKKGSTLQYHNLSRLVKPEILENDEIWKILFLDGSVIFQSFSKFYVYENNKVDVRYGDGEPFLFAHQVDKTIWMERIPSGLERWNGKDFAKLSSSLRNVLTVLPFDGQQFLVGTAKQGLYLLDANGRAEAWKPESAVNTLLKEAQLNNGLKIDGNTFAFGTIKNGIFIIDKEGRLLQHIHKRNGLQNNTVLSMTLDRQGNIWAGLDNGIDRIEVNSPFYYYRDIFGEIGTVYAIKVFQGRIYLGTNQGLFYSNWSDGATMTPLKLEFIAGSQGQVWTLDVFNGQLVCGHNDGTFLVDGSNITRISSWTGGWSNIQLPKDPQLFLQGNYTGLALFENKGAWLLKQKYNDPKTAVISVYPRNDNQFWVVFNNAIQLVEFAPPYQTVSTLKTFSFSKDFPNIQRITPATVQQNIVFATDKGIFLYDGVLSRFKPYEELNSALGSFARAKKISPLGKNSYMFAQEGRFAEVTPQSNQIVVDSSSFNSLQDIVMKNYEVVEAVGDKLLFGLDNGIAFYDLKKKQAQKPNKPLIMGLQEILNASDTLHYLDPERAISYDQNNIRIQFASPWYSNTPVKYQSLLEGLQTEWSAPTEIPYIDFTNLHTGNYTFNVRIIAANGLVSAITSLSFQILPPWYLQWPALLLYVLLTVVAFVFARKMIIEKIKRDKLEIRNKLQLRQQELLRKESEQNEKKLMELKNEQLTTELEAKNRELANAATNIVYKNELLNNLHEELLNVKDRDGKKLSQDQLQKVNKLIDNARSDERDWDLFEKSFNESHENFFKKLKTDYPGLSPNDLKLCAYLRLNMSSKDMASLMNITTRGIEIRRYRLRKKFNLPTEKNLSEFLLEL